jgi:hypothetical protein
MDPQHCKQACARSALSCLYNVSFTPTTITPAGGGGRGGTPTSAGDSSSIKLVIGKIPAQHEEESNVDITIKPVAN